ncbi:unnamed protein product, partial [Didymodactylos carnosus]
MRCTENKEKAAQQQSPSETQPSTDSSTATGPTKNDGTPDMRYKENKEVATTGAAEEATQPTPSETQDNSRSSEQTGPLKADGTADMRYTENKEAATAAEASSQPEPSESAGGVSSSSEAGPTKADGTLDMRYSQNQDAVEAEQSLSSAVNIDGSSDNVNLGTTNADRLKPYYEPKQTHNTTLSPPSTA